MKGSLVIVTLGLSTMLVGCASPKAFLRPMNYRGVEKAKTDMVHEGYIPIAGQENRFVVKGQDAELYRNELEAYSLAQTEQHTARLAGSPYTIALPPDTYGLRTVTADDWYETNRKSENWWANFIDTLWNSFLVAGAYYGAEGLGDALEGSDDDEGSDGNNIINAGGDVNFVGDNNNIGGDASSSAPAEDFVVEGLE